MNRKYQKAVDFTQSQQFNAITLKALKRMVETSARQITVQDKVAEYLTERFKISVAEAKEIVSTYNIH